MAVSQIWRNIPESYNLVGTVCSECGWLFFPGREVCTKCSAVTLRPYTFKGKGIVETFTVIRTPTSDPEGETTDIPARSIPYIIAIIKLNEGPRLTSQLVDLSPENISIGMPVESVFRIIQEKGARGVIHYGTKFRPAATSSK